MEEQKQKAILDVECIYCKNFFDCPGKAKKGQLCNRFEKRKKEK